MTLRDAFVRTAEAGPAPLRLALAALLLHLVLIQPNHPGAITWGALRLFPLELPALLLALIVLPRAASAPVRAVIVAVLIFGALLKLGDFGMFTAFNRPFNLLLDLPLVQSGWHLASGSVGVWLAGAGMLAGLAVLAAGVAALWWACAQWARVSPRRPGWVAVAAVLAAGVVVADVGQARRAWALPADPPGVAFTARLLLDRVTTLRRTLADLAAFRTAAAADPYAGATGLLNRIGNRDVLVMFVESYGRTSFDNPLYSATHGPTLAAAESRLSGAGLAMRSGWLTSPIAGGQSWLAHGTVASGLQIGNQTRYGAMLASRRRTLFHLAAESGFRTAAVMPAITLAWPEGPRMGFQEIRAAADLGYAGAPFNWVTMPDQFTLTALDRLLRDGPAEKPLFAQVALISSHAPWVPIPEMVAWDQVGDGTIFNRWATAGDPPEVVWRDRDRVRDQYRLSIDYALQAVMAYAERHAADPPLLIVLGDHQPAPFVSQIESRDVPVHVIGPPDLVALVEDWGWTDGLLPGAQTPVWPMEDFRDRFLAAFTAP